MNFTQIPNLKINASRRSSYEKSLIITVEVPNRSFKRYRDAETYIVQMALQKSESTCYMHLEQVFVSWSTLLGEGKISLVAQGWSVTDLEMS